MDVEIAKFIRVWISAILCLCYCYYIASRIPKGFLRFLSILPVLYLFIILPLNLSSPNLVGYSSTFLAWLGTFKLILFSFNQGPLALSPNIAHFISTATLPITPKQHQTTNQNKTTNKPKWLLLLEVLIFAMIVRIYNYKEILHPNFMLILYFSSVYFAIQLMLGFIEAIVRTVFGFEIEPSFNKPYLCTSLQDFWGRRWNLTVSHILRLTIYDPLRRISTSFVGPMLVTFLVSGLMHELIYYHLTRASPTWEVTRFFILHGVCTVAEVIVKKVALHRQWLNRAVVRLLMVVFFGVTMKWLLFPQLLRNEIDRRGIEEYHVTLDFVKSKLSFVFNSLGNTINSVTQHYLRS